MLLKLIRFVRGYVTCVANGKFTERLINILNRQGYTYWNIFPDDRGLVFSITKGEYKELRNSLNKTGIRTKIIKKSGLPFLIKKYRSRKGIFVGVIIFILIIFILSKFIWVVTVNGNNNVSTTKIVKVLKENGVYSGIYKDNIELKSTERKILKSIPELRWISINLTGCKAEIEVKEKYKSPKVLNKNKPVNLKSKRDAVIVKSSVIKGTPMVKTGSAVVAGQMLVSGVVESEENGSQLVHSSGEVIGRTSYSRTYKIPVKSDFMLETGNEIKRKRCSLLWFSFPIDFTHIDFDTYKSTKKTYYGYANGTVLPIAITEEKISQLEKKSLSIKNSKEELTRLAKLEEKFYFHNKDIEEYHYSYRQDKSFYYLDADYTVTEDLCVESPIIVEN